MTDGNDVVTVRPVQPSGDVDRRHYGKGLDHSAIQVGPVSITWSPDRQDAAAMQWPRTGDDAVTRIVLATMLTGQRYDERMLLFCQASGRTVGRSRQLNDVVFDQVWPDQILGEVAAAGLPVERESFRSQRAVQRAHPGASPRWYFFTGWTLVPMVLLAVVLVIVIVGLIIDLG